MAQEWRDIFVILRRGIPRFLSNEQIEELAKEIDKIRPKSKPKSGLRSKLGI